MAYSDLLTTVASAMNRSDLTDLIPGFIEKTEAEINMFLAGNPVRPMVRSFTLTATTQRLELPSDFIDVIDIYASDGTEEWPLARIGSQANFGYYDNRAVAPGETYEADKVQQYKVLGDTLVLSAAPTSLDLTLDCFTKLTPIGEDNATNWLMDAHPDVYEFGTLAHAGKHVRDYDFYNRNRDLFMSTLAAVPSAYPERARPIARRMVDSPFVSERWGFYSG